MMQERAGNTPGRPFKERIITVQERFKDRIYLRTYRKRSVTLYREDDPETKHLASLPCLAPHLNSVLVDIEGDPYLLRWQRAKIPREYKILGAKPQVGRDYAENPPKTKISKRLIYARFPKGIDVLLRGINSILSGYLVERGVEASQVEQTKAVLVHLLMLKVYMASFRQLSGEDLDRIAKDNTKFLEDNRLLKPQSPEKQKIQELLQRGFRDSRNRKNYFAALSRLYGIELAIVKRHATFSAILTKYPGTLRVVEFTRSSTRLALEQAYGALEELVSKPAFTIPRFNQQPREVWLEEARSAWRVLRDISYLFIRCVEVRPYVLVTRKAIEHFGTMDLPEGTIGAKVQDSRRKHDIPTITDYLKDGDFEGARQLIEKVRRMIKKTLDVHADYKTVKPSRKTPKAHNEISL